MADPSADTCDEHTPETELNGVSNSDDSQHEPDETELLNLTQRFFGDAPVRIRYCSTKSHFKNSTKAPQGGAIRVLYACIVIIMEYTPSIIDEFVLTDNPKGRYSVARAPIRAGDHILTVNEPYAWCVAEEFKRLVCAECLKESDEALPIYCIICQQVWYCSNECKEAHTRHQYECNALRVLRRNLEWNSEDLFVVKLHIVLISRWKSRLTTNSASQMICSVLSRRYMEENTPDQVNEPRHLNYNDVCVLASNKEHVGSRVLSRRNEMWKWLTTTLNRKAPFNFTDDWIELIGRIDENTFGVRGNYNCSYAYGLYPTVSLINHSCQPNVAVVQDKKRLIMFALKDIMPEEEINISYIELDRSTKDRRETLMMEYNFWCRCPRCCEDVNTENDPFIQQFVCPEPNCDGKGIRIPIRMVDGTKSSKCNLCQKADILALLKS